MFDVQIAHSIQEIGQDTWDRSSRALPFASYQWYRFGERLVSGTPLYILLSQQGEPVARASFWLRRQENTLTSNVLVRSVLGAALRYRPLLICEAPLSNSSGLVLPDDPTLCAEALRTLSSCALDLASQYRVSFVVFSYLPSMVARLNGWSDTLSSIQFPNSGTVLPITWRNYEAYLADLSRWSRKSVRQNTRRATEQGIVLHSPAELTDLDAAMALIREVEQYHNISHNVMAREALQNMDMVDHAWLTAELDGKLVGCALLLADHGVMIQALLGLNYDVEYAYFLLFYETLRCAIEGGQKAIRAGYAAYDLKRRLGFQVEDANTALFAGNGLFHRTGRWLAANFSESPL